MIKQGYRPKVGEELIVVVPSYHRQSDTVVKATAVKVGPQWVYFDNVPGLRDPKFRIRTQHTENRSNYEAKYLTQEQRDVEIKEKEAGEFLLGAGVELRWNSVLRDTEKKIELAEAVKKILNETGDSSLAPEGEQR